MTSLPACHNINAAGRIHHQLFSSSLTGLFEVCNLVRVQFSLYQMASTSKAFKIVCGKIGTHRDDTHNLCVFCLGNEHARDVLEGKSACTMSFFYVKAPLSSCPSFRGKRGSRLLPAIRDPPLPRHGGNEISSWMWPMSEKEKRDRPFSRASAENESELLDCDDAIFISINQIQRLVLFSAYERVFSGVVDQKKKKSYFFSYS